MCAGEVLVENNWLGVENQPLQCEKAAPPKAGVPGVRLIKNL
jgi:hypothetical protein